MLRNPDVQDEILRIARHGLKSIRVVDIEAVEPSEERFFDSRLNQKPAECLGSHHKCRRHRETYGGHFAQGGSFSPYRDDIFLLYLFEPQNIGHLFHARTTHILLIIG